MRKRLIPILITVLVILITAVCCILVSSDAYSITDTLHFSVPFGQVAAKMVPWKAGDGNYYIFMPSCSSISEMKPVIRGNSKFFLAGSPLTDGTDLSCLRPGTPYNLTVKQGRSETQSTLTILQSSAVPAIFISTESGSMRRVDADISHEEAAAIVLMDASGNVVYAGSGKDSIHGRGNTTWLRNKKPYHLTLEYSHDLLNSGSSRHWILLANALDRTNLRNKIVYDTATISGLSQAPSCDYVDVYLNGVYNGLYLLTEQIGTESCGLETDTRMGGFLFEITNKSSEEDISFSTKANRTVRLREPKVCTKAQIKAIRDTVQEMENVIRNLPESNVWPKNLDLDSFAARFLIDEFFINLDSDMASSYYYWNPDSAKMFADPLWDYDLSCGSTENIWSAQSRYPDQIYAIGKPYYSLLYNTPVFREKVIALYRDVFLPAFTDYLREDLPSLQKRIRSAESMDNVRWTMRTDESVTQTDEGLMQFFKNRISYLDKVWIKKIPYCSVWFCDKDKTVINHVSFPVSGESLSFPSPADFGITTSPVWYIKGTDQVFSMKNSESSEVYLCPISETEYQEQPQPHADFGDEEQQDISMLEYVKRVFRHEWQIVVPLACFLSLLMAFGIYLIHESYPPKRGDKR